MNPFRIAKTVIVFCVGLLAFLVAFGNITDYYTNFYFVKHVFSMDTTFKGNGSMYRAITNPTIHHIAYWFIILGEAVVAALCFKGSWQMFKNLSGAAAAFNKAKTWAVYGFVGGILIWFLGFEVIAGEWFGMWMSQTWNGLNSAERIVNFIAIGLIMLMMPESYEV
jgi:predicted small integral membrane protein